MSLWRRLTAVLLMLAALPAAAETAADRAARASSDLRAAIEALKTAESGKDRIAALTATIRAYETGLSSLRDALRAAAVREAEIQASFNERRDQIAEMLGVMTTLQQSPAPLLLLHPAGPLGTARSEMILSSVAPALQVEAESLRRELVEVRTIRALQEETAATLQKGLDAAQGARIALAQAIQERTDLPNRFLADPAELTALAANATTLDAFAVGVSKLENDISAPRADFEGAKGTLPLPALGRVLRRAGEADAAGIVRPGIVIATRPAALVTAPWPATIRYRGPLLDYGNVMILEPKAGYLLVLAGMGTVFGNTGDVLTAGAPVGLMGGEENAKAALSAGTQDGGGADRPETLYIELRQGGKPVDPGPWFIDTKEN